MRYLFLTLSTDGGGFWSCLNSSVVDFFFFTASFPHPFVWSIMNSNEYAKWENGD